MHAGPSISNRHTVVCWFGRNCTRTTCWPWPQLTFDSDYADNSPERILSRFLHPDGRDCDVKASKACKGGGGKVGPFQKPAVRCEVPQPLVITYACCLRGHWQERQVRQEPSLRIPAPEQDSTAPCTQPEPTQLAAQAPLCQPIPFAEAACTAAPCGRDAGESSQDDPGHKGFRARKGSDVSVAELPRLCPEARAQ